MSGLVVVSVLSVVTTAVAVVLGRLGRVAASSVTGPGIAAGIMLWLAFAEIGPEAVTELGVARALGLVAAGAGVVLLVARVAHRSAPAAGVAPVLGVALVLHDLPEGFAVGALVTSAGLAATVPAVLATGVHNVAEKLALVGQGAAERLPLLPLLAAATLPEPVGAALVAAGAAAAPGAVTALSALAAGMMVAVAVGALPEVARRARSVGPFVRAGAAGATTMAAFGLVLPT